MDSIILKSYFTTGLCGTCYRELPAQIEYRNDGAAYITKTCPVHGYEEAMVERSWEFWDTATQLNPINPTWRYYNDTGLIEITDQCNVRCKHCYHSPENAIPNKSADWLITKALTCAEHEICLMGAEPTMHEDLPAIINGIRKGSKTVSIYTNGIRISDKEYLKELIDSGLSGISLSVHHSTYHKDRIWNIIQESISNIMQSSIGFGQVSFTIENKDQVEQVVKKILFLSSQTIVNNFCIRTPSEIGIPFEQDREIFASELYSWINDYCKENGILFSKHDNCGSNPYHVGTLLNNSIVQIIHWGNVRSLDTSYMYMGPWAYFVPNTRGTFLIQAILRDGWKKGWWQGQRLI